MSKHVNYIMGLLVAFTFFSIGCGKYSSKVYELEFGLEKDILNRGKIISSAYASMVIEINEAEFQKVKTSLGKNGFTEWHLLQNAGIYAGNDFSLSSNTHGKAMQTPIYSVKKGKIRKDGVFPVVVYYPDKKLLYLLIADTLI